MSCKIHLNANILSKRVCVFYCVVQVITSCGHHVVYCAYLDDEFYHLDLTGDINKLKPHKVTLLQYSYYISGVT